MNELLNAYYDVKVGAEKETFWIKRLRNILESDIHKKPLGCKINDTHIKIGSVHLHSFYEAQILFSHPHWVRRFATWLNSQISDCYGEEVDKINVIGYETYIEPVLHTLKTMCKDREIIYGVYEQPKFIQSLGKKKSNERIRYDDTFDPKFPFVVVCGISSTLSTFNKILNCMKREIKEDIYADCFSIIQIFPENKNVFSEIVEKYGETKKAESKRNGIKAKYLVDVKCKWELAESCKLCYPDNPLDEKPIIQTSETSVVPIQMIQSETSNSPNGELDNTGVADRISFLEKKQKLDEYMFSEYLYYGHIDRMDHHFKYYVRTGRLIKDILDAKTTGFMTAYDQFINICEEIKAREYNDKEKDRIKIIVSPAHYSDQVFPNAINEHVFEGNAHIISFDINKEYRSSFITKYSNIAYFIEQARYRKCKIDFYYVDDQLTSVESFVRAKSLINSLMLEDGQKINRDNVNIFKAVVVFLSRNSNSSKSDYVVDRNQYYSFIDISIPSIRNFGDSCPICKLKHNAGDYSRKSSLSISANHWQEKYDYYEAQSVYDAKKNKDKIKKYNAPLLERKFRRFECENDLWIEVNRSCHTEEEYQEALLSVLRKHSSHPNKIVINVEYLISIIKAISMPFLFYREYEKKVALKAVLSIISKYSTHNWKSFDIGENCTVIFKRLADDKNDKYLRYELLLVLVNCLSEMDSTYLLDVSRIISLCNTVKSIDEKLLCFTSKDDRIKIGGKELEGFFSCLVYSFKRLICGIGGEAKILRFDKDLLDHILSDSDYLSLLKVMYLENSNVNRKFKDRNSDNSDESDYDSLSFTSIIDNKKYYKHLCSELNDAFNMASLYGPNPKLLKNISFIYYGEYIKPFRFEDEDSLNIYSDEELLKDIKEMETNEEGIIFSQNKCLIRLLQKDKKSMFIVLLYSGLTKRILPGIRRVLEYRHDVYKIATSDIEKGAINTEVQARVTEDILQGNKVVSHGSNIDIISMAQLAVHLIDQYSKGDKKEYTDSYIKACQSVNLFMNHCISYKNIEFIGQHYFWKDSLKEYFTEFLNSVQPTDCKDSTWEKGWDFFTYYISDLQAKEKSKYLNAFGKNKEISINCQEGLVSFIRSSDAIPQFVAPNVLNTQNGIITLIGIIDTTIRNAIKHGPDLLDISISYREEGDGYTLEIDNNIVEANVCSGITQDFFESISEKSNIKNCFSVTFKPKQPDMFTTLIKVTRVLF